MKRLLIVFLCIICLSCTMGDDISGYNLIEYDSVLNTAGPSQTVKICFIHHSTGSDWISSSSGGLGTALNQNNYYVSECDYGWSAQAGDELGNRTDTGDWSSWFNDEKMPYVYANTAHYDYDNTLQEAAGENEIIMFKSCFPNSEVGSSITDEKEIYNSLLQYFSQHTDKMFILVIPPPEIDISSAELTRDLSQWLVDRTNGWLASYAYNNVYAFNYYNILTDPNNHHYVGNNGKEQNVITPNPAKPLRAHELYYPSGDDHPNDEGQKKATKEFITLLNGWYNTWKK